VPISKVFPANEPNFAALYEGLTRGYKLPRHLCASSGMCNNAFALCIYEMQLIAFHIPIIAMIDKSDSFICFVSIPTCLDYGCEYDDFL